MNGSILVTGGAGYIGSHAVRALAKSGRRVVALDNLSRGHRAAVHPDATLLELDLRETDAVAAALREHEVESVLHFAAFAYVGESVERPLLYYENNVGGTISLLSAMRRAEVRRIVFSSTCATYGSSVTCPIVETEAQRPINPYGWSKLFVERILLDAAASDPAFSFVALRYFNVSGCSEDGAIGEDHDPETHLIPVLLRTALGQRESITVFGDDYPTPDGTCIRDYIHVDDLIQAHLLALGRLDRPGGAFYNVGVGRGFSVREAIESVERVTGRPVPVEIGPRRAGDPAELWACGDRIREDLGWAPRIVGLDAIVETAWRWFREHPRGYGDR